MKNIMFVFILSALAICGSPGCQHPADKTITDCHMPVEILKQQLVGKKITELQAFKKCYFMKDTVLEGDEGVSWKAVGFYSKNDEQLFYAETSWEDQVSISRITIVSSAVPTQSGITVGKKVADYRTLFATDLPAMPDGYLAVTDKQDKTITYVLDITNHPELSMGAASVDQLPGDLEIESIVVMNRE